MHPGSGWIVGNPVGVVQAMQEKAHNIKAARMKILVRRGGPNYQAGLDLMRKLGQDMELDIDVYGPETSMTNICSLAIKWVQQDQAHDSSAPALKAHALTGPGSG